MAPFITIIFPFVYIRNYVQEFECQKAYWHIQGKILQPENKSNDFSFASHLMPGKRETERARHINVTWPASQVLARPCTPNSSHFENTEPPMLDEQTISCSKSGTTLEIKHLAPASTPSLFVYLASGNELTLWMDLYFIIIITPPL